MAVLHLRAHTRYICVVVLSLSFWLVLHTIGRNKTQTRMINDKQYSNEGVRKYPDLSIDNAPDTYLQDLDVMPPDYFLNPRMSRNTVYYVFCGHIRFKFVHYLSVQSVFKYLKPDSVFFFYDTKPTMDVPIKYYTYFDELQEALPFFLPRQVQAEACLAPGQPNLTFVESLLSETGGWYFRENTILTRNVVHLRNYTAAYGHVLNEHDNVESCFIMTASAPKKSKGKREEKTTEINCKSATEFNTLSDQESPMCVYYSDVMFPKDIINSKTKFAETCRNILYGSSMIPSPKQDFTNLAPNIAHLIWFGGGWTNFLFYLSALSLLYVAEVDKLYVHADRPPVGAYWFRIKREPRVKLIIRDRTERIFNNTVADRSHQTDVLRVELMIRYGGIYIDTDSIAVRRFDENIRAYDAVATFDWPQWNKPYPDSINFGVTVGKRNAKFWRLFQKTFKWFDDSDGSFNGLRQPYRLYERHPDLIKIEPHLQVICFKYLCHPTWVSDYHNEAWNHVTNGSLPNWRTDAYAYHFTAPDPVELHKERNLLAANDTLFKEIAIYVLEKAGKLDGIKKSHGIS